MPRKKRYAKAKAEVPPPSDIATLTPEVPLPSIPILEGQPKGK